MWAVMLKSAVSKISLKHIGVLAMIAVAAGLYLQHNKIESLESDLAVCKDNVDKANDQTDVYFGKVIKQSELMANNNKVYDEQISKWKAENEKLMEVINDFQVKMDRIQIETNNIKLNKERLENELEKLKLDKSVEKYLLTDVPDPVIKWVLN